MDETKWMIAREIPRLRRYALALVNDHAAADDLVQDTLERAIRKRHLWRRQGSIRSWLYRIQVNVFLNQGTRRRRASREVEIDDAPPLSEPAKQESLLACRDIVAAMRRLPPEQRAAIALTAVEGLSYDEAAEVLSVPVGTIRSRLSRGRDELRRLHDAQDDAPAPAPVQHLRRVK